MGEGWGWDDDNVSDFIAISASLQTSSPSLLPTHTHTNMRTHAHTHTHARTCAGNIHTHTHTQRKRNLSKDSRGDSANYHGHQSTTFFFFWLTQFICLTDGWIHEIRTTKYIISQEQSSQNSARYNSHTIYFCNNEKALAAKWWNSISQSLPTRSQLLHLISARFDSYGAAILLGKNFNSFQRNFFVTSMFMSTFIDNIHQVLIQWPWPLLGLAHSAEISNLLASFSLLQISIEILMWCWSRTCSKSGYNLWKRCSEQY